MQEMESGNELPANGHKGKTANAHKITPQRLNPNRRWTQIYADNIGFGYGSCKIDSPISLVKYLFGEAIHQEIPKYNA